MKTLNEKEIEAILERGVEDGLYIKTANGRYRMTEKGKQYAEAILDISNQNKLETFTYAELSKISADGEADKYFKVGDRMRVKTYTGEIAEAVIIGFNHDKRADNGKAAGITFALVNCLDGEYEMNADNTNTGGWELSKMRNVYMERFFKLLPEDLQAAIVPVVKKTAGGEDNDHIVETTDKLFLLSEAEVFGKVQYSLAGEGKQYPYFKNADNREKRRNDDTCSWWLRSPYTSYTTTFRYVNNCGGVSYINAGNTSGVCFGFCL